MMPQNVYRAPILDREVDMDAGGRLEIRDGNPYKVGPVMRFF